MFGEEIKMGAIGPDDAFEIPEEQESTSSPVRLPKQTVISVDLSEEVKQEIAFSFALGNRKITNAMEILNRENKTEYLIEDLLPSNGLLFLAGASGSGKTILALQFSSDMILGRPTLSFQIGKTFREKNLKVLVISLEMNVDDLQLRFSHMYPKLTDEEQKLFSENYQVYCEPEPFELWTLSHIIELTRIIKACKPDMVLIDSASVSFAQAMTNEEQVRESIKNLYRIRTRLGVALLVAAHTRKPPPGIMNKPEETTLNELMGVAGFAQAASGILIMVEDEKARAKTIQNKTATSDEKLVWIVNAKSRFGANAGAFKSLLTSKDDVDKGHALMFRRQAHVIEMTEEQKRKARAKKPDDLNKILKDAFSDDIDFGSLDGLGDD